MAKSKAEIWREVHARAMNAFNATYEPSREVRLQCMRDRRFVDVPGAMWDGSLGAQFANRPRYEINKLAGEVQKLLSEYANNRITVDFRPSDESQTEATADMLDSLYRADEQYSDAYEAYDNCYAEGIKGGIGAFRLVAKYEGDEEDDDKQRICIEPIYDADVCVFWDAQSKRQDKSDAKRCWVIHSHSIDDYREQWGRDPSSFDKVERVDSFEWYKADVVYTAEYYEVEEKLQTLHIYRDMRVIGDDPEEEEYTDEELDDNDGELRKSLETLGWMEVRTKSTKVKKVRKWIMDGQDMLEDCGYIAGKHIPVVMYIAKRAYVDNIERAQGHIRTSVDAQMLHNMVVSMVADTAAMGTRRKPILTPDQVRGLEKFWQEDSVEQFAYMLLNPIYDQDGNILTTQPLGYTQPPEIPQAVGELVNLTGMAIKEATGNQDAGRELIANVSAQAVSLVQGRTDMQQYLYRDNFAKAMKRAGQIWLGMAKEVYAVRDKMRGIDAEGGEVQYKMREPDLGPDGQDVESNTFDGYWNVIVDTGPSTQSRRDATVQAISSAMQFLPDGPQKAALGSILVMNMDGEGLADIKAWMRKQLVAQGIMEPNAEEREAMQNQQQQPDAQSVLALSLAEESRAKAQKAQADTAKSLADAEKTRADTAKVLSELPQGKVQAFIEVLQQITGQPMQ